MSRTADSKKQTILEFINEYYSSYGETPTVRDIAAGTGIAVTSVHRYLSAMKENGELEYNGRRSVSTRRMEMEQTAHAMPVLGYVACGEGQEETEEVIEYIRMSESLVGKGEFLHLSRRAVHDRCRYPSRILRDDPQAEHSRDRGNCRCAGSGREQLESAWIR